MDTRRVGHAQRRRVGAKSNVYDDTMKPPSFGVGDTVRVGPGPGGRRYGNVQVVDIVPNQYRPDEQNDGHAYVVEGGRQGRRSTHLPSQLRRVQ